MNCLKSLKDGEEITITDKTIKTQNSTITLHQPEQNEYKKLAIDSDFTYNVFELSDKELKHLLQVKYAVSKDITKPILCGIRIENNRFLAIDGYRFSERIGNFKTEKNITISNIALLQSLKGNIKATCNDEIIKYQVDNYTYYDKLIEGDFVNVDKLKPKEYNTMIQIEDKSDKKELLSAIKYISEFYNTNYFLVVCDIKDNAINMIAKKEMPNKEILTYNHSIKCKTFGEPLLIGFNAKYLHESIKNMDDDFTLKFTTNVNPVVIESTNKYELLLPIRMKNI
jgi:DNA polymerase-3 subunit beta